MKLIGIETKRAIRSNSYIFEAKNQNNLSVNFYVSPISRPTQEYIPQLLYWFNAYKLWQ